MRIWSSRPARLAWAVSVAVLVFGHIAVGSSSPSGSAFRALPLTAAAEANDELAEVVGLSRLTAQIPAFEVSANSSARRVESEDFS
jgi:hypothetical protein